MDVFLDALDPCSSDMTLAMSELQAVKRAIACVYLAIPLGAVLMATGVCVCVCVVCACQSICACAFIIT